MREHPGFPVQGSSTVGSRTMEINGTGGGLKGRQAAGQQGAGHARQHIPAAAPGKPRVAGGIDRTAAIRPCNDGVRPLQHHHSIPCFRIAQRHAFPVRIDLCRRAPGQPGHLAGVGR